MSDDNQVKRNRAHISGRICGFQSLAIPAKDSSIKKSGYISEADLRQLEKEDAICDVVSVVFLDKNSQYM